MIYIAAVDRHWAIGNKGQLLVTIPQDQKRFRDMTLGKVIVMGRKTLDTLPGGQPLYGRKNIILSRDSNYQVKGAYVCHSMEECLELLKGYDSEDIYVIGGESIYHEFLPYCNRAEITWIDFAYSADAHFPNLEKTEGWELKEESEEQTYFDLCYTYRVYEKQDL